MMQRTPGLILFCLLTHAATDNELLRCPKSRVESAVREDVTLECHVDPERDVTLEVFKLMVNQSKRVLVYRGEGHDYFLDQHEHFKGRVSLESNSENLSKGEFVVKISPLNTTDAGTYNCTVGKGSHQIFCNIELIIEPKENSIKGNQIDGVSKNNSDQDPGPTPKRGDHNNTYVTGIGIVIGIFIGIFIGIGIGIGIAVMKYRRRMGQTEENNQNDEGTDSNAVERIPLRTLAVSNE